MALPFGPKGWTVLSGFNGKSRSKRLLFGVTKVSKGDF